MNATTPAREAGAPATSLPNLLDLWPRRVQWALASVLLVGLVGIGLHVLIGGLRDSRPTAVEKNAFATSPLDLNRADHAQLRQLPDVGEKLAGRIEEYRRANGPFRSVAELAKVPGIGANRVARLRSWVYVDEEPADEESLIKPVSMSTSMKKPAATATPVKRKGELQGLVDLNEASPDELQKVPGIGPVTAARIIEARKKQPFRSVDDLLRVPGIKSKTLEKLRPFVTVAPKNRTA
jgi:competence protein ComEA